MINVSLIRATAAASAKNSETKLKGFKPHKQYRKDAAIVEDGLTYTAKVDFTSGDLFNETDWNKIGVSETELDEKVDKTADPDKMYGTDEHGDQTTFEKSDFEIVANKTTEIRDANHADDDKYPTELAVRMNLNGLFDSIMDDMSTAVGHINEDIGDINENIGDLSDVANSTDKSTIVVALNTLFKLLKANIAVEIKSDGLYITRDNGAGTPTEDRFAELTDLEPLLQEIAGLHGKTARLNGYDFGMGITSDNIGDSDIQTMLTAYALVQLGLSDESEIPNFIGVHNLYDGEGGNHLLVFNEAIVGTGTPDSPEFPAHWVDNGLDSVSTASNTSLGVVKGSTTDMKVGVSSDGTMSVNGLSTALGTFELVGNKITEIRDADNATNTKYPTELAVRTNLNDIFDYLNEVKLDKTDDENVIYGTDEHGDQTTYDKDDFGKVDTVNGISPDANKNVQTDYVYETEAEFEADKDNIPVGATVIKLYEYPDNLAGFMVVPDYNAEQNINLTNGSAWNVTRSGWLRYRIYISEGQGDTYIDLLINGSSKTVNGGQNTNTKYISDIVQVSKGDTVNIRATNSSGLVTTSVFATYFIPPKFIKKELPVIVEKNGSYSLDEVKTAETWIDGKPIYRKTLYFPALSNMSEVTQDVSGLNAELFVEMKGFHYGSGSINPIPYVDTALNGMTAILYRVSTKVIVIKNPGIDLSDRVAYVTLHYTKTTD